MREVEKMVDNDFRQVLRLQLKGLRARPVIGSENRRMSFRRELNMRMNAFLLFGALSATLLGQSPVLFNPVPSRAVGQARLQLTSSAPNLVEGRELNGAFGVAVDAGVTPPVLYVADTSNNRILVWRNARAASGTKADLVIGQTDFYSTAASGPGTSNSIGLRGPTGLALDSRGNLYVVDTGNNRILRYQRPASQTDAIQPNLVIGQTSFSANQPNQGNPDPSARSIFLSDGSTVLSGGLAFDSGGNLWFTDAGNSRVLRYPASALGDSVPNAPVADLVIGQLGFNTRQAVEWWRAESRYLKSAMVQPSGLGFDPAGRLLVTDGANRLLVYPPPFRTGMDAARIAGLYVNIQGQPARPAINEFTLFGPEGVLATSGGIFVADSQAHRIVRYDPFDQWPEETQNNPSPAAKAVYGQADLFSFKANRALADPSEVSFSAPIGMVAAGNELYLADRGNNRVLVMPLTATNIGGATRVFGQIGFNYRSPNLVEGRELFLSAGQTNLPNGAGTIYYGGATVIDRSSTPPRLYIADTFNNRVVGFADARNVKPGDTADLILGQTSRFETKVNSPASDPDLLTDQGLYQPVGLALDANGNLYVADSGNGRVLRFPRPFEQTLKTGQRANLVIGQSGFNIKITDPTQRNMARPYGLAFTVEGHMLVSDILHNRVLLFRRPANGDFANGQAASVVFGQRDFLTATSGSEEPKFNSPMHIATDTDDRLYVADAGNRRIAIFDRVLSATNNAPPAISLTTYAATETRLDRLGVVQGINVSSRTGEIWVAETSNNRLIRYPRFDKLVLLPISDAYMPSYLPQSVSIDAADNLLVAEASNRVVFYYPGLAALSAAHYLPRRISPGMVAALYPYGIRFGDETVTAPAYPLPKELGDLQVLVDEIPAPLYFVSPGQINFYVPMGLEPGSQSTFIVQRKSTNQILASGVLDIGVATPAFFTMTQNGRGQIAALNEDNTVNTNTNGAARGSVIQLFATGQGFVPNAPPDGTPPSGAVPTATLPRVVVGSGFVADSDILYSGLAPGLVGVWQLNVRIPMTVPPNSATDVVVTMRSIPSNQPEGGSGVIRTVIAVK